MYFTKSRRNHANPLVVLLSQWQLYSMQRWLLSIAFMHNFPTYQQWTWQSRAVLLDSGKMVLIMSVNDKLQFPERTDVKPQTDR